MKLTYKGYIGMVDLDEEQQIFHGEVINTRDVITFAGSSVADLKRSLADSVEDYLEFCRQRGEEPDRPFSGKFIVRLSPEIHRAAFIKARSSGKSLNAWVGGVIEKEVSGNE